MTAFNLLTHRKHRLILPTMSHRRTWDTFEEMRQAAMDGDAQAQCYLGVSFQNGQGVPQDYNDAVKWFRRAAEQNDPVAQCYLGVCYMTGAGVPQEYTEAARWLREAAEQGDPAAQFNLGLLYETGQGLPQNYAEAIKWYREAAQRGYPAAQFNLGVFYVGVGGMKGTTINQALEVWIRFGAFLVLLGGAIYMGLHYGKLLELIQSWTGPVPGTGAYTKDGKDLVANGVKWSYIGGGVFKNPIESLSMVIGLSFGTIGLPHILLRFYTNPSAKEARYSALFAIAIASTFFAIALYLGVAGRYLFLEGAKAGTLSPENLKAFVVGGTNMVVPTVANIIGGKWLLGIVVAGAFAAVFSNLSGLFIACSGALGHDVYTHFINKTATEQQKVVAGKVSVVIIGVLYGILGLLVQKASIGHLVGLAFNVAASTFAPIFLMGVWWRGMTEKGAIAGMVVGLASSCYMIFFIKTLPIWMQWKIPGLVTVPLAFLTVYIVSKIDGKVPADVNAFMKQIHSSDVKA